MLKKHVFFVKFFHAARFARHLPFHGCHLSLASGKKAMLSTPDVTLLQRIGDEGTKFANALGRAQFEAWVNQFRERK
nr:hypothetical protein PJ912_13585 [Pectobacterium colocasium]